MRDEQAGQKVPDLRLERFEAPAAGLSDWRGRRLALFCFSTWCSRYGSMFCVARP